VDSLERRHSDNATGEYLIVNRILQKGLHTESDECMTYTTNLMDKLEKTKAEQATNDAIHDDMAAQAYVEQFAQDTFQRAENAVKASKVTAYATRLNSMRLDAYNPPARPQTPTKPPQPSSTSWPSGKIQ
jgi:uncharacterized membrane-anchored protein YjiN (DUF445 family)